LFFKKKKDINLSDSIIRTLEVLQQALEIHLGVQIHFANLAIPLM